MAVDFFAAVFLVAVVAVPALARPPALPALGSDRGLAVTCLNAVPGLNFGTAVFRIRTVSPVRGLRPVRAARAIFSNVPKPVMPTLLPLATSRMMTSTTASTASLAAFLLPRRSSSFSIRSALFMNAAPSRFVRTGIRRVPVLTPDDQPD